MSQGVAILGCWLLTKIFTRIFQCSHTFCLHCLQEMVQRAINSGKAEVRCPLDKISTPLTHTVTAFPINCINNTKRISQLLNCSRKILLLLKS